MIRVLIPNDFDFNYKQNKKLYKKYRKEIGDQREFRDIAENTFFYSFYDDDKYIGFIYFYYEFGKLFVNACANRHTHNINIECFKQTFDWFTCDIYARSQHKTAIYCLYKLGFKKIKDGLYIYERS